MEDNKHRSQEYKGASEAEYEEEYVGAGDPSCWYGYDISYAPNRGPEHGRATPDPSQPYEVVIFRKHGPWLGYEEAGGHRWEVSTNYTAWFPTLEEARAAAEAFCDELHWKREAEWLGTGEELANELAEMVNKAAEEMRQLWNKDPEGLRKLFK